VFATNDGQQLVTIFKSPVEVKIDYPATEAPAVSECPVSGEEVAVPVPVFLYSFNDGESNFRVWKPFQNYEAGADSATINFKVWGDPPFGVTRLATPRNWGPP
jgi:hypothetical protein